MIGFETIRERLLDSVRNRIRNGEVTERGLARSAGISQPHVHNLLKGVRTLNAETGDQLLNRLGINVLDLIDRDELQRALYSRILNEEVSVELRILKSRLGPGLPWNDALSEFECVKVPVTHLARVRRPLVARLADDPAMDPVLTGGDLVLLDSSEAGLQCADPETLFAIEEPGGVVIRWIRRGQRRTYLIAARDRDEPHQWETVSSLGRVRARAIPLRWLYRQEALCDPLLPLRDTVPEPARPSFPS